MNKHFLNSINGWSEFLNTNKLFQRVLKAPRQIAWGSIETYKKHSTLTFNRLNDHKCEYAEVVKSETVEGWENFR